ncbi:hypothetical protein ACIP3U_28220 [[Kitasatospora] papulosa]|uniref:hypothetical protein n=1 Tax=[Kitasatospora] papulosa TaxID=1464011 RepID=UPI0037FB4A8B
MTDSYDDGLPDWVRPQRLESQSTDPAQTAEPAGLPEDEAVHPEHADPAGQTATADAQDAIQVGPEDNAGVATPGLNVSGNHNAFVVAALGSVFLSTGKQPLTVTDLSEFELRAASQGWVSKDADDLPVTAADEAAKVLSVPGSALAVIVGPPEYGKRTAGIRALWRTARSRLARDASMELKEIQPDWEDPAEPDCSVLPDAAHTGYLLHVENEMAGWVNPDRVAGALAVHAEKLAKIGSCLVLIADERVWPQGAAHTAALVRVRNKPSAQLVARTHLEYVYDLPGRADLVTADHREPAAGVAARLLTAESTPADGARLAALLAAADGSPQSIETALSRFQKWSTDVSAVFKATTQMPEDRALLIAAIFLSGEDALAIQEGARALLGDQGQDSMREILTGPDLSDRLASVKAKMSGRRASFDHRPGYTRAVLLHLWHQRPDAHAPLLHWLDGLVADQAGSKRLEKISDLLVELAIAENDIRVVEKIKNWIGGSSDEGHLRLIASVLSRTAQADRLGPAVRAKLLDWAQDGREPVARVVAMVCQSDFAQHYPRQALVRIQHILGRAERDTAVTEAEAALRAMAAKEKHLPSVWRMVNAWAAKRGNTAGSRAFLAVIDPQSHPYALQVTLASAAADPVVADALVTGWSTALENRAVDPECRVLIDRWAHARADGTVPREHVTEILGRVISRYLTAAPVSALLIGEPGVAYDAAVIELRADLRQISQAGPWSVADGSRET